jgi:hypothetical protein
MQMNTRWIRLWLICLGCNEQYLSYCTAKRNNDPSICSDLESNHPRIQDIYAEFGDIYEEATEFSNSEVKAWLESRCHLFFNSANVSSIADPQVHVHRAGHILLDIELSEDVDVTLAAVKRMLSAAYLPEISYRLHTGKSGLLPLKPIAKYQLHGECNTATLGRVKKAVSAGLQKYQNSPTHGRALSITEAVLAIKKQRSNPFGWCMGKDDLDAEKRGTFGKHILNSSEVAMLKRHRKDFTALVHNAIHGRFPDFS